MSNDMSTDNDATASGGDVRCPNCNTTETSFDLSQETHTEYRCGNGNCCVEVFRVDD